MRVVDRAVIEPSIHVMQMSRTSQSEQIRMEDIVDPK